VRSYFEQRGECVIVLPVATTSQELTDDELEAVAGGEEVVIVAIVIAGDVISTIVHEWICS
jgi:hypothetical protein